MPPSNIFILSPIWSQWQFANAIYCQHENLTITPCNRLISVVAMISTKFIRFSFDKLARTHKIARSFSPRVLVPKPVPTGSAYVTHAPQEPHFGSDTVVAFRPYETELHFHYIIYCSWKVKHSRKIILTSSEFTLKPIFLTSAAVQLLENMPYERVDLQKNMTQVASV